MQLFFWFSIILLSFASFAYISIPMFLRFNATAPQFFFSSRLPILLGAVCLGLGSIGLYAYIGSSAYLSLPQNAVIDSKYVAIIEQIETHLAQNPEDAEGWQVVAPTYLSLNQPEKAFDAFANAIKFGNSNGPNWLGLGKSNLIINKGVFGPMTKVAFTKAQEKSPDDIETMYFYATMLQNNGELAEAKSAINGFIASHEFSADQIQPLTQILDTLNQAEANQ
ncbi:MAG: hypothetical protein COB24_00315 [Hyphomicrobiales bacterium]|nr:MAG: hypothetical protein COB24_00315 [Hyphomicrobiales bacterium]